MYYLWQRNDGHVGASAFMPVDFKSANGKMNTFIKLGESENWNELMKLVPKQ